MATNCEFCGTMLEENQICTCEGSSKVSNEEEVYPFPKATSAEEPQPQMLQAVQERIKTLDYQGMMGELKDLFWGAFKKPLDTAKSANRITMSGAFTTLGLQAFTFMLLMWSVMAKMASLNPYGGGISMRWVVLSLVVALLEIVWMYGALYLCCMAFRSKIGPRELLSTVAVASPAWTATFVACTIFSLLFGISGFSFYSVILLCFFAMIYSVFMLAAAIRSQVSQRVNVLLMVSIAYAAQAIVSIRVFAAIMTSMAQSAMSSLYW